MLLYVLLFVNEVIHPDSQFDDIGPHGTKIVIYNLWLNDDGDLELDFSSDPEV